jgi:F0F1-type ATP synthase assembly protein I
MGKRSFWARLLSVEVFGGAVFGAGLPYLAALLIETAPRSVPIWLVTASLGLGATLSWIFLRARRRAQQREVEAREARERAERERREQVKRLERLERAILETAPRWRSWPRRVLHRGAQAPEGDSDAASNLGALFGALLTESERG